MIHNCSTCAPGKEPDCATCKLAFLSEKKGSDSRKAEKNADGKKLRIDDDDEQSISERLTDESNGKFTILYLFVMAAAMFLLVILFTLFMRGNECKAQTANGSLTALDATSGNRNLCGNPIITDQYSADPSARVFGDALYVYPSHDKDDALTFSMEDYHAFRTTDMVNYEDCGVIFNPLKQTSWAKSAAWAPDCIERNGKYYLYYPTDKRHIGVAVSDSPTGPFVDPIGKPLISIDTPGVVCDRDFIDPCVFIDDDGQAYLFMGQNTVCCVKLNDDMVSYSRKGGAKVNGKSTGVYIIKGVKGFFEAVWVHKRGRKYYISYSTSPLQGDKPRIDYAVADKPLGPYKYAGTILDPVNSGTNHHSITQYKGNWYLFYHTADLSRYNSPGEHCGVRRSVCCDPLYYNSDGSIRKVVQTIDMQRVENNTVAQNRDSRLPDKQKIINGIQKTSFPDRRIDVSIDDFLPNGESKGWISHLQHAIDSCSLLGGGMVRVSAGTYELNGPLVLKSNVNLHLMEGAYLKFSGKASDFLPVVQTKFEGTELYGHSPMIRAQHQVNIAITGKGTIDAQAGVEMGLWGKVERILEDGASVSKETPDVQRLRQMGGDCSPVSERIFGEGTYLRPTCIEPYGCSRVLIEGITIKDSPFWTIHPTYCDNVIVRGVTIDSHFPNNDGCDPESSSNVLIEDCVFRCGDDAVAIKAGRDADGRRVGRPSENIVIRRCQFSSECNGLCIGSEMSGGVQNVVMDSVAIGTVKNALYFKSNRDRGGYIRNVKVTNITVQHTQGAVLRFESNYFGYRGGNFPATYENFHIQNVDVASSDHYAIFYDGLPSTPIRDIRVKNFRVKSAPRPYYLFHTRRCTFENCTVNGQPLPLTPPESPKRESCDVW